MARVASAARLSRILAMVPWVIQHPEQATVEAVCSRFGIDRRQLTEDLELLFCCGIPPFSPGDLIEAEIREDRVIIEMADYLARPLRLNRYEAVTILAAGKALATIPGVPDAAALGSALDKLSAAIQPGEADAAAALADLVEIELDRAPAGVIDALRDAIVERKTVRIEYFSSGRGEIGWREVDPLLVFGSHPLYVAAVDQKSGERRTFRVDRIRAVEQTGRTFEPPEGFDPAEAAGTALYHPAPGDEPVVLELAPAAAWVAEVTPHDALERLDGGRIRLTLRTGPARWLEHLLLSLGEGATVIEPVDLAESVREAARRALGRYDTPQA